MFLDLAAESGTILDVNRFDNIGIPGSIASNRPTPRTREPNRFLSRSRVETSRSAGAFPSLPAVVSATPPRARPGISKIGIGASFRPSPIARGGSPRPGRVFALHARILLFHLRRDTLGPPPLYRWRISDVVALLRG
jgi:hypothetical protein